MTTFAKSVVAVLMIIAALSQRTIAAAPTADQPSQLPEQFALVSPATIVQNVAADTITDDHARFATVAAPKKIAQLAVAHPVAVADSKPAVAQSAGLYGRLIIPAISLSKPLAPIGLTAAGALGVLNDPTQVGWYGGGVKPGQVGSAVLDAHVFQAFAKLKDLQVGDEIDVMAVDGSKLVFTIDETEVYPYNDTTHLDKIFNRADAARLVLITCYGSLTSDHSTYTHRLVVYAKLVSGA